MKDGSLLVSDDFNGAIYRVSRTAVVPRFFSLSWSFRE